MAENQVDKTDEPRPERKPYGPGVLMILGLFLLAVAAWCGYDLYAKEEWVKEERTGAILMNWGGLILAGVAAVYSFILAAVRSRKGAAGTSTDTAPPESDA